jgi:hypothetical protein
VSTAFGAIFDLCSETIGPDGLAVFVAVLLMIPIGPGTKADWAIMGQLTSADIDVF